MCCPSFMICVCVCTGSYSLFSKDWNVRFFHILKSFLFIVLRSKFKILALIIVSFLFHILLLCFFFCFLLRLVSVVSHTKKNQEIKTEKNTVINARANTISTFVSYSHHIYYYSVVIVVVKSIAVFLISWLNFRSHFK